jgi:hypothetical protein
MWNSIPQPRDLSAEGGKPGMKFSWPVTGIRQDARAEANPIQVEAEKHTLEQAHYLHPKLYCHPEERGLERARHPEAMRLMKEERERSWRGVSLILNIHDTIRRES